MKFVFFFTSNSARLIRDELNTDEQWRKANGCCHRLVVRGTNGGDGIYIKNQTELMNGKVVYETPLGDRFLFFQGDRFTVVRNDTAESQGYQNQFLW